MKKGDKKSILVRVVISMLVAAVLQTEVFYGLLVASRTFAKLNENSKNTLTDKVARCSDNLQEEMLTDWGSMEIFEEQFREKYQTFLSENQITSQEFDENTEYQKKFIADMSSDLILMLRQNKVNGVFLILNGNTGLEEPKEGQTVIKQGINIRDMDQNAGYLGQEDLFLAKAPASVLNQLDIPLDSNWQATYTFTGGQYNDVYYKPLQAAQNNSSAKWNYLGYWSGIHNHEGDTVSMISYSIPLLDDTNHIVGVAGVEIMESYIIKQMRAEELDESNKGEYVLAIKEKDGYQVVTDTGYPYISLYADEHKIRIKNNEKKSCYELLTNEDVATVYGDLQKLDLYSANTLFEEEQWYVIGLLEESELFKFSIHVRQTLFGTIVVALAIAGIGSIFLSKFVVRPIRRLSNELKEYDVNKKLSLKRTNIREIDQLVGEVEHLQNSVLDNNNKLSTILDLAEVPIGAFELNLKKKTVFFTECFFKILDYDIEEKDWEHLREYDYFVRKLKQQDKAIIAREEEGDQMSATYYFQDVYGQPKWARVHAMRMNDKVVGIMLNVTKDFEEKMKLQHERDHDLLTNLYNRWAFHSKMQKMFATPLEIGMAAMVMIDLDNLKYVNDSYGHDMGDAYIKAAAAGLEECLDDRMLLARMSGDEFYVFLHHYDNKEDIRQKVAQIHEHALAQKIQTIKKEVSVRMTGGVAWYPEDTTDYQQLIHYADFAMYQAKRYSKGEIREFCREDYDRDSYLLRNSGELNSIIEGEQVQYYFQPIVNANTGEIYAYEALIRPISQVVKRPDELLALARSQGRLYQIEKLTWKKALEEFRKNATAMDNKCKIFINSVSSQILNPEDFALIEKENHNVLDRVVLELTEEERVDNEFTDEKRAYLNKWHAQLALDDFGSGYNGENLLLELEPDYVKVDMNIIRNIDKDEKRQIVFNNLLSYTREHNIMVIAEGVETVEEFKYVRDGGADLIQGYLFGKPSPQMNGINEDARKLFNKK